MFGQELNLFKETAQVPPPIPGMRPSHIYPSGASVKIKDSLGNEKVYGGCNRKQYLQYVGERPSDIHVDEESLGVWTAGDQIQDVVEGRWKGAGVFLQSELPVYIKEYNVSGRIDTILYKEQVDGSIKLFGAEIKSKSGYYAQTKFISPPARDKPTDFRPSDDHILQSMCYMHACNTQPHLMKHNITKWLIVYVLRDSYAMNYFELELTNSTYSKGEGYPILYSKVKPDGFIYGRYRMQDILDRWTTLNKALETKNIPERDYINIYSDSLLQEKANNGELSKTDTAHVAKGNFHNVVQRPFGEKEPKGDFGCAYCPFRSKCWGLGEYKEHDFECEKTP